MRKFNYLRKVVVFICLFSMISQLFTGLTLKVEASSSDLNSAVTNKLNSYRNDSQFGNGVIWGGTTDGSYSWNGWKQCCGFALHFANTVFGSYPANLRSASNGSTYAGWTCYYVTADNCNSLTVEPGDIIDSPSGSNKNHTAMVLSGNKDNFKCVQCNYSSRDGVYNKIHYDEYFNYNSNRSSLAKLWSVYGDYVNSRTDAAGKMRLWKPSDELKQKAAGVSSTPQPVVCNFKGSVSVNPYGEITSPDVSITISASDNHGISSIHCNIHGIEHSNSCYSFETVSGNPTSYSYNKTFTFPYEDEYTLEFYIYCANGDKHELSFPSIVYKKPDVESPTVHNLTASKNGDKIRFTAVVTDNVGVVSAVMLVNDKLGTVQNYDAEVSGNTAVMDWDYSGFNVSKGIVNVQVSATDTSGNIGVSNFDIDITDYIDSEDGDSDDDAEDNFSNKKTKFNLSNKSFIVNDIRGTKTAALNTNSGKPAVYFFGKTSCYNCKSSLKNLSELTRYMDLTKIDMFAFDLESGMGESAIITQLKSLGISDYIIYSLGTSGDANDLFMECAGKYFNSTSFTLTTPMIVYKNSSNQVYMVTEGLQSINDINKYIKEGGTKTTYSEGSSSGGPVGSGTVEADKIPDEEYYSVYTNDQRVDLSNCDIAQIKVKTYDGKEYRPTPKVRIYIGGEIKTLTNGVDYRLTYDKNTNAGEGKVTVLGIGNFKGSNSQTFTINKKNIDKVKKVSGSVSLGSDNAEPIHLYDGSKLLKKGIDYNYTITSLDTSRAGTAKITVEALTDSNYIGQTTVKVPITDTNGKTLLDSSYVTLSQTEYTYDGKSKKPIVTVTVDGAVVQSKNNYSVSYLNNKNVGTAYVVITGKGKFYTGKAIVPFTIKSDSAEGKTFSSVIVNKNKAVIYNGKLQRPSVVVKYGKITLKNNRDYVLNFYNNLNAGSGYVKITGIGNYEGMSKIMKFTISPQSVKKVSVSAKNTDNIIVKYKGKVLVKDIDYTVTIQDIPLDGKANVTITGLNNFNNSVVKKKVKVGQNIN